MTKRERLVQELAGYLTRMAVLGSMYSDADAVAQHVINMVEESLAEPELPEG